ncbi:hypothetical protein [Nonomuraea angiospora]
METLKQAGLDPAPERASTSWAGFLRSQADALLACDFIETVTLHGQRQYILAVIEHAARSRTWSWTWTRRAAGRAFRSEIGMEGSHLRYALREYEQFYNQHRAHQALDQAAPRVPPRPRSQTPGEPST